MIQANTYLLQGAESKIEVVRNFGGQPNILLDGELFEGVRIEETSVGPIASVVLSAIHDERTDILSVILPPVNLDDGGQAPVVTAAIFSIHKTTIGGPDGVSGQIVDYKIEPLTGVAEHRIS